MKKITFNNTFWLFLIVIDLSEYGSEYLFSFNQDFSFKVFGIFVDASLEMRNSAKPGNVSGKLTKPIRSKEF